MVGWVAQVSLLRPGSSGSDPSRGETKSLEIEALFSIERTPISHFAPRATSTYAAPHRAVLSGLHANGCAIAGVTLAVSLALCLSRSLHRRRGIGILPRRLDFNAAQVSGKDLGDIAQLPSGKKRIAGWNACVYHCFL